MNRGSGPVEVLAGVVHRINRTQKIPGQRPAATARAGDAHLIGELFVGDCFLMRTDGGDDGIDGGDDADLGRFGGQRHIRRIAHIGGVGGRRVPRDGVDVSGRNPNPERHLEAGAGAVVGRGGETECLHRAEIGWQGAGPIIYAGGVVGVGEHLGPTGVVIARVRDGDTCGQSSDTEERRGELTVAVDIGLALTHAGVADMGEDVVDDWSAERVTADVVPGESVGAGATRAGVTHTKSAAGDGVEISLYRFGESECRAGAADRDACPVFAVSLLQLRITSEVHGVVVLEHRSADAAITLCGSAAGGVDGGEA